MEDEIALEKTRFLCNLVLHDDKNADAFFAWE